MPGHAAMSGESPVPTPGGLPTLHFPPELPISSRVEDITAAITAHQVVIVAGATGSGKTTQLPKVLLAMGRGRPRQIGVNPAPAYRRDERGGARGTRARHGAGHAGVVHRPRRRAHFFRGLGAPHCSSDEGGGVVLSPMPSRCPTSPLPCYLPSSSRGRLGRRVPPGGCSLCAPPWLTARGLPSAALLGPSPPSLSLYTAPIPPSACGSARSLR
ncbi:ATP-dependent RNA helicase HrpA [Cystobacter fuscus]|uniref:ATP-dependent RNA helicase HrpA n=1 Tax=Cystobacter fuscus TaxID=43 RepID=A0A250J623_9BACT|nr:ATP-dependent RNA helicase HrpA [Cystobacter fuscus]